MPTDPVAITLALADKLDTLVGFWAIDEKPTGSSDPFALRRAALGAIRVLLENRIRLSVLKGVEEPIAACWDIVVTDRTFEKYDPAIQALHDAGQEHDASALTAAVADNLPSYHDPDSVARRAQIATSLLAFLADRLKVQLREQGKRHDLVDAVFALGDDDLVRIVARVEALDAFLRTEDGANLLSGYKRAANILAAEEKKGAGLSALTEQGRAEGVQSQLLQEPAEKALATALANSAPAAKAAVEKEDFAAAMSALSSLRAPVDAFFDAVLVNSDDKMLRRNRLLLLRDIRDALNGVADFSKVEG